MPETPKELATELRRTNRLLALLLVKGDKQKPAIAALNGAGLAPKEIAEILGTTPGTVSATLSNMKKTGRGRKPSAAKSDAGGQ